MPKSTCSIPDCEREHYAKTYCQLHWKRWRTHGDPHTVTPPKQRGTCTIDDCGRPTAARGWCMKHWQRWKKHGSPTATIKERPTFGMTRDDAFRHYMPGSPPIAPSPTEGCWIWTGPSDGQGYGAFRASGYHKAHRASYELFVGPIPDGRLIRHTCDTPLCVQPAHLIPGTDADNNRDMMERGRNRQPHGVDTGQAKLTDDQVLQIRRRYAAGGVSQRALGIEYGVHQTLISNIVRRAGWKHVS